MNFLNKSHGLELFPINSTFECRKNENGILFLVIYFLLKKNKNALTTNDIALFNEIVKNITTYDKDGKQIPGLYDRGMGESLLGHEWYVEPEQRRTISHDNLTAISAFSKLCCLPFAKDIAIHAIQYQFRFDNCYPGWQRFIPTMQFHPRDWFYWLYNGFWFSRLISYPFFPIFFFANIITCMSPLYYTSGKWLMFVRLEVGQHYSFLMKINYNICKWILRKKFGKDWLHKIANVYHHCGKHPIVVESKDLYL
jgi:hypothetical protein